MKLISCWHCGVVLDYFKLIWHKLDSKDARDCFGLEVRPNEYLPFINCPHCDTKLTEEDEVVT